MPKSNKEALAKKAKAYKVKKTIDKSKRKAVLKAKTGCTAGSPEHRRQRWKEYKQSGGKWSKERWTNVYNSNMNKASKAHAEVDKYHKALGWGTREVTVRVQKDIYRRLDIADKAAKRGVEHKTGYICLSKEILWEVQRDAALVKDKKWDIVWHFLKSKGLSGPSLPLELELKKNGIKVTTETQQ